MTNRTVYVAPVRVGRTPIGSHVETCPLSASLYAMISSGMLRHIVEDKVQSHFFDFTEEMSSDDEGYASDDVAVFKEFCSKMNLTYKGEWYEQGMKRAREVHYMSGLGMFRTGPDDSPSTGLVGEVLLVPRVCATPFGPENTQVSVHKPAGYEDMAEAVQSLFISRRCSILHGHHHGVHDIGEICVGFKEDIERARKYMPKCWERVVVEAIVASHTGEHHCHLCALTYIADCVISEVDEVRVKPLFKEAERGYFMRTRLLESTSEDVFVYNERYGNGSHSSTLQTEFSSF